MSARSMTVITYTAFDGQTKVLKPASEASDPMAGTHVSLTWSFHLCSGVVGSRC